MFVAAALLHLACDLSDDLATDQKKTSQSTAQQGIPCARQIAAGMQIRQWIIMKSEGIQLWAACTEGGNFQFMHQNDSLSYTNGCYGMKSVDNVSYPQKDGKNCKKPVDNCG